MPTSNKNLVNRPPVVVVMGHIDHGKSTILDYIRKANVVAGEAGGITQHVGAYQAMYTASDGKARNITFLDTPGHAAFGGIRERGANAADIAILVVSAEDGVKPQTIEAFKVIQKAKVPYIVAITKIDKPNANIEKAKQSLGENEIYVEGWGGDTPCVAISAITGAGIPDLLDMIMLVAEMANLTTDPALPATGVVVEASLDTRKGVSATLLVRDGTLNTGTFIVADSAFCPVRFIEDFKGTKIDSATASMPVRITGWNEIPASGTQFIIVDSKKDAEKLVQTARNKARETRDKNFLEKTAKTAADAASSASSQKTKNPAGISAANTAIGNENQIIKVPLIIKADVIGSLEGVKFELKKISHNKVQLDIISEGIGDINENDIKLATSDPNVVVVGFNAEPDKKSATQIERSPFPLTVRSFSIIYDLAEYVQSVLDAKIPKEYEEQVTGRAKILAVFSKEKDRQIVGGKVETGIIESGNDVRLMRRDVEIGRGKIRELQEKKLRTKEVAEGHEFGMMVEIKFEVAPGDRVEAVRTVEV